MTCSVWFGQNDKTLLRSVTSPNYNELRCKIFGFLSPLVLSKQDNLALLGLNTFCGKVRLFFNTWIIKSTIIFCLTYLWNLSFKNWKLNTLSSKSIPTRKENLALLSRYFCLSSIVSYSNAKLKYIYFHIFLRSPVKKGQISTSPQKVTVKFWFRACFLLSLHQIGMYIKHCQVLGIFFQGMYSNIINLFWSISCSFCSNNYWWFSAGICKYKSGYKLHEQVWFECSHWLKSQHSDWRANLVKEFFSNKFSTNESTRVITGHVIYNPSYTHKFQLKTNLT